MKKQLKLIPKFKNEDQERDFWTANDSVQFFDINRPVKLNKKRRALRARLK